MDINIPCDGLFCKVGEVSDKWIRFDRSIGGDGKHDNSEDCKFALGRVVEEDSGCGYGRGLDDEVQGGWFEFQDGSTFGMDPFVLEGDGDMGE